MTDTAACPFPVSAPVAAAFAAGLAAGLDPDTRPTGRPSHADLATPQHVSTTLRSRWLHRPCPTCQHTFRPGDAVVLHPTGQVVHDMPQLGCPHDAPASAASTTDHNALFAGLTQAWPLPDDLPVLHLTPAHWLVAPPRAGFSRHTCRICGHSLRPGDRVVLCPCNPSAPRCRVAVHRDIVQQLHCWDQWQRGDASPPCLATT